MIFMKYNKFLFIAMIFFVSFLCVSSVSAADDAASDIVADTSDATVLEESIDDVSLGDSQNEENILTDDPEPPYNPNFTDLENKINSGASEIELIYDYNCTEDNYKDGIEIKHDLIINGNGQTIDGNGKARIFHVSNYN